MSMRRTFLPSVVLFLIISVEVHAQNTRVLFIGNSFTYVNDLPGLFTQLAASMGETVQTGMSAPGGYTFQGHTTLPATTAALAQGDWDYVVLQEQSQLPSFPPAQVATDCYPYAAQLAQQARAANPCVEVIYMMTWGKENGDDTNCASWPPVCTYEGMQQRLHESYVQMAVDNSAWCAPVGEVWRQHREQFPAMGLYSDGSHPNIIGSYIAASTLCATIFRRTCEPATSEPGGMPAGQAAIIRTLASGVVLTSEEWNIGVNDPVAEASWNNVGGNDALFANNTTGAVSQEWHFGDGAISTDVDPMHTYANTGAYTVTLIVADVCGRTDTLQIMIDLAASVADASTSAGPVVKLEASGGVNMIVVSATSGLLEVLDTQGRALALWVVSGSQRYALPDAARGTILWRLTGTSGRRTAGRLIVP